MNQHPSRGAWARSGPGAFLLALLLSVCPAAHAEPVGFELPADGEVFRYQRVLVELDHPDPGPEVILYADGRLQVRRPVYQTRAGLWQKRLDPQQMRQLLADVVASGLIETDVPKLRERKADLQMQRRQAAERAGQPQTYYAAGDPDRSLLRLRLAGYAPPGELGGALSGPIERSWQWTNLYGDAGRFPEIRELAAFHRLELRLIEFIDDETFERVASDDLASKEVAP